MSDPRILNGAQSNTASPHGESRRRYKPENRFDGEI
jgi:hypothetical protein